MPEIELVTSDGSGVLQWHGGPLRQPGDTGGPVQLAVLLTNEVVGADPGSFKTGSQWSCTVGGVEYEIRIGVIRGTRKVVFIGVPSGVTTPT